MLTISNTEKEKTFHFYSYFENRKRIFYGLIGLIALLTPLASIKALNLDDGLHPKLILFLLGFLAVYFFVAYRFLKVTFEKEIITLKDDQLIISKDLLGYKKNTAYDKTWISDLKIAEKAENPLHELTVGPIDALGFEGRQRVIQDLNAEGVIQFEYFGKKIAFAKEASQENAEEFLKHFNEHFEIVED